MPALDVGTPVSLAKCCFALVIPRSRCQENEKPYLAIVIFNEGGEDTNLGVNQVLVSPPAPQGFKFFLYNNIQFGWRRRQFI